MTDKFCKHTSDINSTLIFVRESDFAKSGSFIDFAKRYRPSCFFDLRFSPRLDFFAGSRLLTFRLFDELSIDYFDLSGSIGNGCKSTLLSDFLELLSDPGIYTFRGSDSPPKTAIILFDDELLLREWKINLPNSFQHSHRRAVNIAEYKSGFLSLHTS